LEFHGNYIPLQGVEYIIKAAKILEKYPDIKFKLIGNGQTYPKAKKLAEDLKVKNIEFISERVPYESIPAFINGADICLGIFGSGDKTQRVIPNKLYEAVAMKKAVITGDTPGIKEIFTDQKDIMLCRVADEKDLAEKILILKNNPELKEKIALNGYQTFQKNATPQVVAAQLIIDLKEKLKLYD